MKRGTSISVLRFTSGPMDTNCYLVFVGIGSLSLVVDAPWGVQHRLASEAEKRSLRVLYLVNTHGHWDHAADNEAIRAATRALVVAHRLEVPLLEAPAATIYTGVPFEIPSTHVDLLVEDGSILDVGDLRFQVLHTPGHTSGAICLYEPDREVLFTGDTLFHRGYGRTDLPGADEDAMWRSLARLSALPDEVRVFPGHGPETTVGQEDWLRRIPAEL